MRVCSLGSGSKGNATLVESGDTRLLIDCGFGLKEALIRLESKGVQAEQLSGILVSHEHSDHGKGVGMLARKAQVPVLCSAGTYRALLERNILCDKVEVHILSPEQNLHWMGVDILPLTVPHDARETLQFILQTQGSCFGVLTDVGSITPHLIEQYSRCRHLLLEFNHDSDMLWSGPYPQSLKERVGGPLGHLSNEQAIAFLKALETRFPETLLISHISEQNNCVTRIAELLEEHFDLSAQQLVFANQDSGCDWVDCI